MAGIFVSDIIKLDLSTGPVPVAGSGPGLMANPVVAGFHRLSLFGNDTVFSTLQNTMVTGGWPNGRRSGDDMVHIAVSAVLIDLRVDQPTIIGGDDNVDSNDFAQNKVFPYATAPLNGRDHQNP